MLRARWTKVVVFLLCLAPAAWLGWRGYHQDLSANPIEFITRYTGDWTLRFLVIGLAVTPLRKLLKQSDLIKFRRMLGLFAFFYVCVHLLMYLTFDQMFSISGIVADVLKRPYITVGTAGFLMLVPLAITSTAAMVRRLGPKRWQLLHRLVYFCALAGVIHYYWLVKSDVREPVMYGAILTLLMLFRVRMWLSKGTKSKPEPTVVSA